MNNLPPVGGDFLIFHPRTPMSVSPQIFSMQSVRTQTAGINFNKKCRNFGLNLEAMKNLTFVKLFLYYTFSMIPFAILFAFLSLFHRFPIQFNDKPTYGVTGFIVCIAATPLWGFLLSGLSWVALFFGRWLYTLFLKLFGIKEKAI